MNIKNIANNCFVQEESLVWLLEKQRDFEYSDGAESERYLRNVFSTIKDLSSGSSELESYIKDWPSEYHLTAKRSQLFAGFDFDPTLKVLEVGCGCGAITRFLGESFNEVVSIEGSIRRARLARLRTRDLEGVTIVCAPFQEIDFTQKFDIVFCIGVFEYSASFVSGKNPYDSVLGHFNDLLSPDGTVVMAIENQFGLKYFNSSREDHTGVMFEGIEGYHAQGDKVRTFGKVELEEKLKKYFSNVEFYYPYPDYKLPTCIISDDFLSSGLPGELVSQIGSRDYFGEVGRLWDETLVSLELSRNGMLPFFSNSFLVFAGKSEYLSGCFNQLAIKISSQRASNFKAITRIITDDEGSLVALKEPLSGKHHVTVEKLTLVKSSSVWIDSYSLHTMLHENCMSKKVELSDVFMPCRKWISFLEGLSIEVGGINYLDGAYVDCNFSNVYLVSDGIELIDREWVWGEKIRLNVVVIRAIYTFLGGIENEGKIPTKLKCRSMKKMISRIAKYVGIDLGYSDFVEFVSLENEFQSLVTGRQNKYDKILIAWLLADTPTFNLFKKIKKFILIVHHRIKSLSLSTKM